MPTKPHNKHRISQQAAAAQGHRVAKSSSCSCSNKPTSQQHGNSSDVTRVRDQQRWQPGGKQQPVAVEQPCCPTCQVLEDMNALPGMLAQPWKRKLVTCALLALSLVVFVLCELCASGSSMEAAQVVTSVIKLLLLQTWVLVHRGVVTTCIRLLRYHHLSSSKRAQGLLAAKLLAKGMPDAAVRLGQILQSDVCNNFRSKSYTALAVVKAMFGPPQLLSWVVLLLTFVTGSYYSKALPEQRLFVVMFPVYLLVALRGTFAWAYWLEDLLLKGLEYFVCASLVAFPGEMWDIWGRALLRLTTPPLDVTCAVPGLLMRAWTGLGMWVPVLSLLLWVAQACRHTTAKLHTWPIRLVQLCVWGVMAVNVAVWAGTKKLIEQQLYSLLGAVAYQALYLAIHLCCIGLFVGLGSEHVLTQHNAGVLWLSHLRCVVHGATSVLLWLPAQTPSWLLQLGSVWTGMTLGLVWCIHARGIVMYTGQFFSPSYKMSDPVPIFLAYYLSVIKRLTFGATVVTCTYYVLLLISRIVVPCYHCLVQHAQSIWPRKRAQHSVRSRGVFSQVSATAVAACTAVHVGVAIACRRLVGAAVGNVCAVIAGVSALRRRASAAGAAVWAALVHVGSVASGRQAKPVAMQPSAAGDSCKPLRNASGEGVQQQDCIVCFDAPRTVLLLPCRHVVLCAACLAKLRGKARGKQPCCPFCRAEVQQHVNIIIHDSCS